ncbi:MAG TPA: DUF1800 domain-containing protein [Planctomycetes bacterium]|nr:DUF1800 domain-containing protein [Planctomycetota bacterium]
MKLHVLRPWRPGRGEWNRAAVYHLARRAGFGAGRAELDRLLAGGVSDAVDRFLSDDAPDARLLAGAAALLPQGEIDALAAWWMSLILSGKAPLRERIALLWHDHFATSFAKVKDVRMMHRQNTLFRERGLGDFRELLHAVATDPAMLIWLDGDANRAGTPNENFAREVMELFALGIGNYTERDIQESARALTGWGTEGRSFRYRAPDHDGGTKTIFGERGTFGGEEAIDLILAQPACPRHIARRLLEEFVAPNPRKEWVEETAELLVSEDWSIGRTVEVILRSELFFSPQARRSRIAGPIELVATTIRTLGARVPARLALEAAMRMGQIPFQPPSVKGWDGMKTWINAGAWVARHNALWRLARAHVEDTDEVHLDLRDSLGSPKSNEDATRFALELLTPDLVDGAFAEAVRESVRSAPSLDEALTGATALVLTAPEYHLI